MIAKLASQAGLWYNEAANIVVPGGACDTPGRIYLYWRSIMDSLSHHAHKGNSPFVTIPLNQGYSAIVDLEDADLAQLRWHVDKNKYAIRQHSAHGRHKTIIMHRVILARKLGRPIQPKMHVDHINGDSRDNRRVNLREASVSQNLANQKRIHRKKICASPYKGVTLLRGHWQASISYQKRRRYLGWFATSEEAAKAYDQAALEIYGEYAAINFPLETDK